jgi:hypothetical protein
MLNVVIEWSQRMASRADGVIMPGFPVLGMIDDQFHLGHDFDCSKEQIEAGRPSGSAASRASPTAVTGAEAGWAA